MRMRVKASAKLRRWAAFISKVDDGPCHGQATTALQLATATSVHSSKQLAMHWVPGSSGLAFTINYSGNLYIARRNAWHSGASGSVWLVGFCVYTASCLVRDATIEVNKFVRSTNPCTIDWELQVSTALALEPSSLRYSHLTPVVCQRQQYLARCPS